MRGYVLAALLALPSAPATVQSFAAPTQDPAAPVVVAQAERIRMVATVDDYLGAADGGYLAEIYEGDFLVTRRLGGRRVPRVVRLRFTAHARRRDRPFETLAILVPTQEGYYSANRWTPRREDERFCLPVALIARHGLGARFRARPHYESNEERCERRAR